MTETKTGTMFSIRNANPARVEHGPQTSANNRSPSSCILKQTNIKLFLFNCGQRSLSSRPFNSAHMKANPSSCLLSPLDLLVRFVDLADFPLLHQNCKLVPPAATAATTARMTAFCLLMKCMSDFSFIIAEVCERSFSSIAPYETASWIADNIGAKRMGDCALSPLNCSNRLYDVAHFLFANQASCNMVANPGAWIARRQNSALAEVVHGELHRCIYRCLNDYIWLQCREVLRKGLGIRKCNFCLQTLRLRRTHVACCRNSCWNRPFFS